MRLTCAVSDGITLGCPCCGVAHCDKPLETRNARFCKGHSYLHGQCAVAGCKANVATGRLSCEDPDHQALEDKYEARRKANFQLRHRSKHNQVSKPADEADDLEEPDNGEIEEVCPASKDPEGNGNLKLRGTFGRRQTHNEQIIVRPCGIIIARATFFGSESVPQVAVSS